MNVFFGSFRSLQQTYLSFQPGLMSLQTTVSPRYGTIALLILPSRQTSCHVSVYVKMSSSHLLLLPLGHCRSGPPVSEDTTVVAHTQRAATARILQLHVRHTV